ncbi:hypothetical protein ACEWY4_027300 [Coilia grayii]|uniref:HTH CENPB-type domain-containing protein n=1 Tax=Coilia grayii TaxID=363190 RepID=A0ABD1IV27_9TELE
MSRPQKCRRMELTLTDKVNLIKEAESTKMRRQQLGEKFGIGKTTVTDIIKKKNQYLKQFEDGSRQRVKTTKFEDVSALVWMWFQQAQAKNIPVSGPMVQEKALAIATDIGVSDFKVSNGCPSNSFSSPFFSCQSPGVAMVLLVSRRHLLQEKGINVDPRMSRDDLVQFTADNIGNPPPPPDKDELPSQPRKETRKRSGIPVAPPPSKRGEGLRMAAIELVLSAGFLCQPVIPSPDHDNIALLPSASTTDGGAGPYSECVVRFLGSRYT